MVTANSLVAKQTSQNIRFRPIDTHAVIDFVNEVEKINAISISCDVIKDTEFDTFVIEFVGDAYR